MTDGNNKPARLHALERLRLVVSDAGRSFTGHTQIGPAEATEILAEIEDLRCSVVAFGAPAMVEYANMHNLPRGHLHPQHYDILKRAGAWMDDFTRAEVSGEPR